MALLDVSSVLLDPDFGDFFHVIRRVQAVSSHGRVQTEDTDLGRIFGVITANSPSDLDRREDYQSMTRSISVVCQFYLRGETSGFQPDVLVWQGSRYLVKHVDAYPQFGKGFFQAECSSIEMTDPAIVKRAVGQLAYNAPINSIFLAG